MEHQDCWAQQWQLCASSTRNNRTALGPTAEDWSKLTNDRTCCGMSPLSVPTTDILWGDVDVVVEMFSGFLAARQLSGAHRLHNERR
jgi:hypothetical protein